MTRLSAIMRQIFFKREVFGRIQGSSSHYLWPNSRNLAQNKMEQDGNETTHGAVERDLLAAGDDSVGVAPDPATKQISHAAAPLLKDHS